MNDQQPRTLKKSLLLDWLYLTGREVSIEELGKFITQKTDGQYCITTNQQTFFSPSFGSKEKKQNIA